MPQGAKKGVDCFYLWNIYCTFIFYQFLYPPPPATKLRGILVSKCHLSVDTRRVWRYQRGNQNPYIEEEQTTQWPKENVQKDKQRSTKHTYKTKDRVIRTPLKTGGELRCSERVSGSCSTSNTRCVNLVANPVMRIGSRSACDKWNISVVICDTEPHNVQ
jgi:hypothetical protein